MKADRVKRHIFLLFISAAAVAGYFWIDSELTVAGKLSVSSAYVSLLFFVIAIGMGPVDLWRNKKTPLSSYLRRDLGIWSALLAVFHTLAGLQVHLGGKFWHYFVYPSDQAHLIPIRYDFFGLTNHLGLLSAIVMVFLLVLSNNRSIKRLGAAKWKNWQRSAYVLIMFLPLHGVIYQALENRLGSVYSLLLGVMTFVALSLQISGIVKFRSNHGARVS